MGAAADSGAHSTPHWLAGIHRTIRNHYDCVEYGTLLVNAALRQEYEALHAGVTAARAALITAVTATVKTKRAVEREVMSAFALPIRKIEIHTEHHAELPFELARRLLIACEDVLVLNAPLPNTRFWRAFQWARDVIDSLTLNFHGASRMSGSVGITIAFAIVISVVNFGVLKPFGLISSEAAVGYTYACWTLLGMAIAFSKPSRYALTGYSRNNAERVIERIPDLGHRTEEAISAIQYCLQRAEEETKSRLNTTKWIAGSLFAVAIYFAQKGFDLRNGELITYALPPLAFSAFVAGFIAIHARGTTAVYGLAHAVLHRLKIELHSEKTKRVKRTSWLARKKRRRAD